MRRAGLGDLHEAFLRLKGQLQSEGLFEPERKRPIASLPRSVGIITSLAAAALRDVLTAMERRAPHVRIIIYPAPVQGAEAPPRLRQALETAIERAEVDTLLLVRGGGSLEDLWGFNEEIVVRAAAASRIPLISAVGHETDWTLIDHAADMRAPTPTGAAEMAVPVRTEILAGLQSYGARSLRCVQRYRERAGEKLDNATRRLPTPETLLGPQSQRVDELSDRLKRGLSHVVAEARGELAQAAGALRPAMLTQRLDGARSRLDQLWRVATSLNPDRVLERGYARVERRAGGTVISAADAKAAGALVLRFADGSVDARVERSGAAPYVKPKSEQPDLF